MCQGRGAHCMRWAAGLAYGKQREYLSGQIAQNGPLEPKRGGKGVNMVASEPHRALWDPSTVSRAFTQRTVRCEMSDPLKILKDINGGYQTCAVIQISLECWRGPETGKNKWREGVSVSGVRGQRLRCVIRAFTQWDSPVQRVKTLVSWGGCHGVSKCELSGQEWIYMNEENMMWYARAWTQIGRQIDGYRYIDIYKHLYLYVFISIYISVYIQRERERERQTDRQMDRPIHPLAHHIQASIAHI